jgi:hypothetical protein
MLAPVLVAVTALRFELWGWVGLAALFATAGLALRPASAWAERRRTATATTTAAAA